jgi:hypothetical protein
MAVTRANLASLLVPGLRKVFWMRYKGQPEEYSRVFNVNSSRHKYEDDSGIHGLGVMPEKTEGASVSYGEIGEAYTRRYTHTSYGLAIRITREMNDDELYGVMGKMTQALARSAKYAVEQQAANVFNNGFTAYAANPDGLALFSTAHLLAGSSTTFANKPSTDADLSVATLQAGLVRFEQQVDDKNLLIVCPAETLLVSPSDMFLAQEILRSPQKPFTADNEINVLRGLLRLEVNHFLTDTDAWFILSSKENHSLNFFWRTPIEDEADNDFDTGDLKFKVFGRFSVAFSDWRGTYGSQGA